MLLLVPASLSADSSKPPARLLPAVRPCLLPGPGNVCARLLPYACELCTAARRASVQWQRQYNPQTGCCQ